jgi:hypothetical protein
MPIRGRLPGATVLAGKALLIIIATILSSASAMAATSEHTKSLILRAVEDRICYESFWRWNHTVQYGKLVDMSILYANGRGYAWGRDLTFDKMIPGVTAMFGVAVQGESSAVTLYMPDFDIADPTFSTSSGGWGEKFPVTRK